MICLQHEIYWVQFVEFFMFGFVLFWVVCCAAIWLWSGKTFRTCFPYFASKSENKKRRRIPIPSFILKSETGKMGNDSLSNCRCCAHEWKLGIMITVLFFFSDFAVGLYTVQSKHLSGRLRVHSRGVKRGRKGTVPPPLSKCSILIFFILFSVYDVFKTTQNPEETPLTC